MIKVNFNSYNRYLTDSLYQWDINQVLKITGLNLDTIPEVHFSNVNMDRAIVRQTTKENNIITVDIPNSLLQEPFTIYAHIGIYEGDIFKVIEFVEIPVIPRKRPLDYQIQDSDEEIYSFKSMINLVNNSVQDVDKRCSDVVDEVRRACDDTIQVINNSTYEKTSDIEARLNNIIAHNNDTTGNSELVDIRIGDDGRVYDSAGYAVRYQLYHKANKEEFLGLMNTTECKAICSENIFDDTEYRGLKNNISEDIPSISFYGNFNYIKRNTSYYVGLSYTDGTTGDTNMIFDFLYSDGTQSEGVKPINAQSQMPDQSKRVIGFIIRKTAGYQYTDLDKIIDHVWMSESRDYTPYNLEIVSERLDKIQSDVSKAMLSSDFTDTKNLLKPENITDNLEIQPYTEVYNAEHCSAYIPIETGQTLYVNYSLGTPVGLLCDENKNKISWVSLPFPNNGESRNTGYTVTTEGVKYIRLSWVKSRADIVGDLFFSTDPIRYAMPDSQYKEELIPGLNEGYLRNWWYMKEGDSLGDSLTGQNYMQSWTRRYFGLKVFENHGVGGTKLSGTDTNAMWQDERIEALSTTADFVTVLGGQNDGNVEIGEISKSNYDTDTYVGALNTIIDKIYDHCKSGVMIILCTPFYVPAEGETGDRFMILGDAVKEIGKLRGLPVADFGGLSTADKKTSALYWDTTDKTHPKENFYRDKVAPILINTMEQIKPIDWSKVRYYTEN